MLRRGPPPGARDPMDQPQLPIDGPPAPPQEAVERRYRSAIHHAAMVYRRLTATHDVNHVNNANSLRADFVRLFGEAYEDEEVRVIRDEDDDPSKVNQGGEEEEEDW